MSPDAHAGLRLPQRGDKNSPDGITPGTMRNHRQQHAPKAAGRKFWLTAAFLLLGGTSTSFTGDILRGGASVENTRARAAAVAASGQRAAAESRARFQDRLARTTMALQSARSMQAAARAAAGADTVPDGLTPGGLERYEPGQPNYRWDGAEAPSQNGQIVTIHQKLQQAVLNWKTFNIGRNTTLHFDQSAGGSKAGQWVAFNNVLDPTGRPSQILGRITAPGQVYVINQNGIIFGGSSQVNTRALVASSLPINMNLVENGLLNNPDLQFLFSALPLAAGSKGTPAFIPDPPAGGGPIGAVIVEAGAQITTPTSADNTGGRVALIGPRVVNNGEISTPDGQTILAAGLQVGWAASSDPSLRGLETYVGAVTYPVLAPDGGVVHQNGLISAPRGAITITGREIRQNGMIESSTSVSLNGRVDLIASFNAVANPRYDSAAPATGKPFLYRNTGTVHIGSDSFISILPEWNTDKKLIGGTSLTLPSRVNIEGLAVHFGAGSGLLATSGEVNIRAGHWSYLDSPAQSQFLRDAGQAYVDKGSFIDVSGSRDVVVPMSQNFLSIQLRGAELANSPVQRGGILRGATLIVDLRRSGAYFGRDWIGTPLADLTGYLGLIERSVGELTIQGGKIDIQAGGSVVIQNGASLDVSGGWRNVQGGIVSTTRLLSGNQIIDIGNAAPDRIYTGIYDGRSTVTHTKWGISKTYRNPFAADLSRYEPGYLDGAGGGNLSITAPTMALDGSLFGQTVIGPRQLRSSTTTSSLPQASSLALLLQAQRGTTPNIIASYPHLVEVVFGNGAPAGHVAPFTLDAYGNPGELDEERRKRIALSTDLLADTGFGSLTVNNEGGSIELPRGVDLNAPVGGLISLTAGNITISGSIFAPGGTLAFKTYNITPEQAALAAAAPVPVVPDPNPGMGIFRLARGSILSTAGLVEDDRPTSTSAVPRLFAPDGGSVSITAYTANLANGSLINASGGLNMNINGKTRHYGDGGSISILAGHDPGMPAVLGGKLSLGSILSGFAGGLGGSLAIQAPLIQVGGKALSTNSLVLSPDFFSRGGFASFHLTGLGEATSTPGKYLPGVYIAPGTRIEPMVAGLSHTPHTPGGLGLTMRIVDKPVGIRSPVNLSFSAPGVKDAFSSGLLVRGDVVMGQGAVIKTDPLGGVSFNGNTVTMLGSIFAPAGTISLSGGTDSKVLFPDQSQALATVYIGPGSVLSAAGTTLMLPDPFNRRTGSVLPGGTISLRGNIVAAPGSMLDVSGASGIFDVHPAVASALESVLVPANSGLTTLPFALRTIPVRLDSSGGLISMQGGQMLFSEATLLGRAGGPTATGGSLIVSSGRFYPEGVSPLPDDINLIVKQSGSVLGDAPLGTGYGVGLPAVPAAGFSNSGLGYFIADVFRAGDFDALALKGNVQFLGPVSLTAGSAISVADGGVLWADSDVRLTAPYVSLGMLFQPPVAPEDRTSPFLLGSAAYNFAPTHGPGRLYVTASTLDVGTLSLQNIGGASLSADRDLRGSGFFNIAGTLDLRAGQIYPVTASDFTIVAYDYTLAGTNRSGAINITGTGPQHLPLSAGGTLSIYASAINQGGVLRAPFGTINLGWDGTGTKPSDLLAGNTLAFPVTSELKLAPGSVTSVSAIDPITGRGVTIPYGVSPDGTSWIDPRGVDITAGGLPEKTIRIAAQNLTLTEGATIDIRGGGELLAYRWEQGNGGTVDILSSTTSFAILPGAQPDVAPYAPFALSLNADYGAGYSNSSLGLGDRVYLAGSKTLPAGYYTLLPAHYALLPGAVLVTPLNQTAAAGSYETAEGASIVSGYRYNGLNSSRTVPTVSERFEVASSEVVNNRAKYEVLQASSFLSRAASELNIDVQRLPRDSGYLLLQAADSMSLLGEVSAQAVGRGRGGTMDISSPKDIVINNGGTPVAGAISLSSEKLSGFEVESLLVGGRRTRGTNGTSVEVLSGKVTLDNAGSTLSAPDVVLAAKMELTLAAGSSISSSGPLSGGAETLLFTGDGTALRVSGDEDAAISRTGTTGSTTPKLTINSGSMLSGAALLIDSSAAMTIHPGAILDAGAYSISSGRISMQLDNPGLPLADGLILGGALLEKLGSAHKLSLAGYSSIDIYGTGDFGGTSVARLTLNAPEIRGFNNLGSEVRFSADEILLGNSSGGNGPAGTVATSGMLSFEGKTIRLGANQLGIEGYNLVNLNASAAVIGEGSGALNIAQSLAIKTPLLTGASGADRTINAGAAFSLGGTGAEADITRAGLGSTLNLSGASLDLGGLVFLPSGLLFAKATSGDLVVNGRLDTSGTRQEFYDTVEFTDGGIIELESLAGNVNVNAGATVSIASHQAGGAAGSLIIRSPQGAFLSAGTLIGSGSSGHGSFALDTHAMPSYATLGAQLTAGSFSESQVFRVRTGDVALDGIARARTFRLSADAGSVLVTGLIDASGEQGGEISLAAHGDMVLGTGSVLDVSGYDFSNAGKGGLVQLEAGAQTGGVVGPGSVQILSGSTIDLSVASMIDGDALTPGTSAYFGQFSGKLHIRAPQIAGFTDLAVAPIGGDVIGASSILVEGYRLYDLTSTGGLITGWRTSLGALPAAGTVQRRIYDDATAYLSTANHGAMLLRLLGSDPQNLHNLLVLAPGVEIINLTGNLRIGSDSASSTALGSASQTSADWNLADFRFGPNQAPGVLTLRAAGNIEVLNALSDGFRPDTPFDASTPAGQQLWLSALMAPNLNLPLNTQSWSFRLSAGADLGAADFRSIRPLAGLAAGSGSLLLGKFYPQILLSGTTAGANATTATAINNRYQVIRTGTGDITINAARDVQLRNQFASIYTAGVRVPNPTLGGTFDVPLIRPPQQQVLALGAIQQSYAAYFSMAGGDLSIRAQENIRRVTQISGQIVDDSVRQLPSNWLYRRGYVDPETGEFGRARNADTGDFASTAWWVDFSNFFFDIGALGGGNVTLEAGQDIRNVNAALPTNGRMSKGEPEAGKLVELGGGDLIVRAGRDIDAGIYYVQRGMGILSAGRDIITNPTRSPSLGALTGAAALASETWLPTTLFLGQGGFDISARGNILLGPVANAHLLPPGYNNTVWYKTYFSTYSPESYVNIASLGGAVTLRTSASLPASGNSLEPTPLLLAWAERQLFGFSQNTRASFYQPWLRLAERATDPFRTVLSVMPPILRAIAYAGDINLVGDITLAPSPSGTAELFAAGAINGLQPNGVITLQGTGSTKAWATSRINISDANPASIPGVSSPFGYQTIAGISAGQAVNTQSEFLKFIDNLFLESGATLGTALQTKLVLHGPGPLHAADQAPVRLYARTGDISGLSLFSPKYTRIFAGRDISDIAFYLQNVREDDISMVSAGRNILAYNSGSILRIAASSAGNIPLAARGPLAGDIQIGGPGSLQVLAGRKLDLGTGADNGNGTGTGITSIGNARNPYLPFGGASLFVGAGLGSAPGLGGSDLDFDNFINLYVKGPYGAGWLSELSSQTGGRDFDDLTPDQQKQIALQVFYLALRDAGRLGSYEDGFAAIATLFSGGSYRGDILTRGRDIRTKSGGDITIFAPGGGLQLASSIIGNPSTPPGIITETGGNISIFTDGDIGIGVGRSFTLRGGNQILWSSAGDIAAGSSAKTVQSAPPTRVIIDPTSATVQTDLAGLATGGGIGVLATVAGIEPGDVDLIAPTGTVDAGDAGIRVSGNLSIAADQVLNADNIQVAGGSAGVPTTAPVAASVAPSVAPSSSTSATSSAAQQLVQQSASAGRDGAEEAPSIITVEVLGYGGGEGGSDREEEEEKLRDNRQASL